MKANLQTITIMTSTICNMMISGIYMYQVTSTICNMMINGIYVPSD